MRLISIKKKPATVIMTALSILLCSLNASGAYIPTNRDTRMPPQAVTYDIVKTDGYEKLSQVGNFEYWYREDRDIILVKALRTGYTWKTGLDAPFGADADRSAREAEGNPELEALVEPKEDRLNATYVGFANSLLSVEIYDDSFNSAPISSAGQRNADSKLMTVEPNHYRLDAQWSGIDLNISMHVYLTEDGLRYKIADEDITGEGANRMASLIITPFLGAAGGAASYYDPEEGGYGDVQKKPMPDGYILVPDGSGGLIRFKENTVELHEYVGSVYGQNYAETMFRYNYDTVIAVAKKEPVMPVFGISHGNNQAAFVAWADSGAEHMEIVMFPHNNMTNYNYAYGRYVFNREMHQVYNRRGDGYFRLFPERLHYDVDVTYAFLAEQSAGYVGMALKYRDHLLKEGVLKETKLNADGIIPIRLDFIMSDVKKSVVGFQNVVTTTAENVTEIIGDLFNLGVRNVNGGLLGFQKGGITTGIPWDIRFDGNIGGSGDFKKMFAETQGYGADISLAQDYYTINEHQMTLNNNQAFHVNHWGTHTIISEDSFTPVQEASYARPAKSAEWFEKQQEKARGLGAQSATAIGMTDNLISHYSRSEDMSAVEAAQLYQKTFAEAAAEGMKINSTAPNMFLWKVTDRFLQAPVLTSQYILETDTVPFLQLVLNGTMEIYAPYSNFSFYTQNDILRMIDYNTYPSFILTKEPAHLLSSTNSLNYYSTEYDIYRDIILDVYGKVSDALTHIKGSDWTDREVLENGVVVNTYANGVKIYINYTDETVTRNGVTVKNNDYAITGIGGAEDGQG